MKTRYLSLFVLMLLSGVPIFLWIIEYDVFVNNILHFYGKEDKIAIFKSQYLSADKFQIIRYISIIIPFLFCISIPFLERKIKPSFVLLQMIFSHLSQSVKGIHTELLELSQTEKYWFWGSFIGFTFLKIYFLLSLPFFVDEAFSYVHFVHKGFLVTMTYYPGPNNHVAYNLMANCIDLFPINGIWVMRLPSLIISIMTFILLFVVVKRVSNFFTAISTVWILNLFFTYNYYSVSGRGYILYVLCFICVTYCLYQLVNTRKQYYILGYVFFSILGGYAIPTFVYPVISSLVIGIIVLDQKWKWIQFHIYIFVGVLLLYSPIIIVNGLSPLISNGWVKSLSFYQFIPHIGNYILESYNWLWNIEDINIGLVLSILLFLLFSFQYYKVSLKLVLTSLYFVLPFCVLFFQKVLPFSRIWIYLLPLHCLLLGLVLQKNMIVKRHKMVLPFLLIMTLSSSFILWKQEFKNGFGVYDELPQVTSLLLEEKAQKVFIEEDTYHVLINYTFLQHQQPIEIETTQYDRNKMYDFMLMLPNSKQEIGSNYKLILQNTSIQVYKRLK